MSSLHLSDIDTTGYLLIQDYCAGGVVVGGSIFENIVMYFRLYECSLWVSAKSQYGSAGIGYLALYKSIFAVSECGFTEGECGHGWMSQYMIADSQYGRVI